MSRTMPRQRPGKSEQTVCTPPAFLDAVKHVLGIDEFYRDLAANHSNYVADVYYTVKDDGLSSSWATPNDNDWNWLNPPYSCITPWVLRACAKKPIANTAVLVPASVGSNWWRDYVHRKANVLFLNGRITFVGHTAGYPKDLALLLYSPTYTPDYDTWNWRSQ